MEHHKEEFEGLWAQLTPAQAKELVYEGLDDVLMEKIREKLFGKHMDAATLADAHNLLYKHTGNMPPSWTVDAIEEILEKKEINTDEDPYNSYDIVFVAKKEYVYNESASDTYKSDPLNYVYRALNILDIEPGYAHKHYLELKEEYDV